MLFFLFLNFYLPLLQYLCWKFKGTALCVCARMCVCVWGCLYRFEMGTEGILYDSSMLNNQIGFPRSVAAAEPLGGDSPAFLMPF